MAGFEGRKNSDRNSVERRIVVRRRGCFGIGIVGGFMYVSMIILFWYSHKYIDVNFINKPHSLNPIPYP